MKFGIGAKLGLLASVLMVSSVGTGDLNVAVRSASKRKRTGVT